MLILLGKMDVAVYMLAAEAVVPHAAGAVPELKLGIVDIRPAADGALVRIKLSRLLLSDTPGLAPEIHRARARSRPAGEHRGNIPPAENEEVQHRDNGQEINREGACDNRKHKERRVNQREILHLHRDDEHEQHLHIREQRRKREEHRQVDILGVEHNVDAEHKVDDKAVQYGQNNAGEKVAVELRRAPILLKRAADPIIKIEGDKGDEACIRRVENKGHDTPYLPVQDKIGVKRKVRQQNRVHRAEKPERHVRYRYIRY